MTQFSDDIFLGPVLTTMGLNAALGEPSPMELGVGPMGRIFVYDIIPLTAQAAGLAALQTTAGAGNLVLTAGTGVTTTVDSTGTTRYVLDVPRAVTLTSTGNISAVNFTISGYDVYGQPMTAVIAGPNNNTVATLKAFKSVISVAVSAAVATNTSVGFNDTLGMPVRVIDAGNVIHVGWAGALANDTGTFTVADQTSPATTTTGDVRGTYLPSSASNGTKRLVVAIHVPSIGCGPLATRVGALGVTQV